VQKQLQDAGVTVDLLPATVPPGYDADAFVAIHADDGGGADPGGWKISTVLRYFPDGAERIKARLPAGTRVRAVNQANGAHCLGELQGLRLDEELRPAAPH
jgi:hypothetical protein